MEGGAGGTGEDRANCEDVSGETGPKPGQTRGQTRQIARMSQAGRATKPGQTRCQTRPNQESNQKDFEDVLGRIAQTRLHQLSLMEF